MKESAVDCALNYRRNMIAGKNNSRECDYNICDYKCDGIDFDTIDNSNLDEITYHLYYTSDMVEKIIVIITDMFSDNFKYDYNVIKAKAYDKFPNSSDYEILFAIKTIINENRVIVNKYGINSFLRETNNIYYLSDTITTDNNYLSAYYSENPTLVINTNMDNIINQLELKYSAPKIQHMLLNEDIDIDSIKKASLEEKETILENIIYKIKIENDKSERYIKIFNYFSNFIKLIDDKWMSALLYESKNKIIDQKWKK